jgi:uncharacterized membrane protein
MPERISTNQNSQIDIYKKIVENKISNLSELQMSDVVLFIIPLFFIIGIVISIFTPALDVRFAAIISSVFAICVILYALFFSTLAKEQY